MNHIEHTLREYVEIPGYTGYSISRRGQVWDWGRHRHLRSGDNFGHPRVCLGGRWHLVKDVMLVSWHGYEWGSQGGHRNGDITDNRVENIYGKN